MKSDIKQFLTLSLWYISRSFVAVFKIGVFEKSLLCKRRAKLYLGGKSAIRSLYNVNFTFIQD